MISSHQHCLGIAVKALQDKVQRPAGVPSRVAKGLSCTTLHCLTSFTCLVVQHLGAKVSGLTQICCGAGLLPLHLRNEGEQSQSMIMAKTSL